MEGEVSPEAWPIAKLLADWTFGFAFGPEGVRRLLHSVTHYLSQEEVGEVTVSRDNPLERTKAWNAFVEILRQYENQVGEDPGEWSCIEQRELLHLMLSLLYCTRKSLDNHGVPEELDLRVISILSEVAAWHAVRLIQMDHRIYHDAEE